VFPGDLLDDLSPLARLATATAPFVGALILRISFGKHSITRWVLSGATLWFFLNVLLAPYSSSVVQDIMEFPSRFR
jgi:hypothetical protein